MFSAFNHTAADEANWKLSQDNFSKGKYSAISPEQLKMYRTWAQADREYRAMSYIAVGVIAVPVAGVGAPALFGVSTELAGAKAALSFGLQATMNGVKNVDYIGVAADAWTAPGLDALINGSINWRPFALPGNKFQLVGVNKSAADFAIDAGAVFLGGVAGDATWRPLQPLLHNPTEKTLFFLSTQAWLTAGSQGAAIIIKEQNEKK